MNVDLTLAVNYLPACACLGKVILLLLIMLVLLPAQSPVGLVLTAGIIYMDRLIIRNIIFDANAIILAVFFSHIYAVVRAESTHRSYAFLMYGAHLSWAGACIVLILEPFPTKSLTDARTRLLRWAPPLLMVLMVSVMTYFHADLEPMGVIACRSIVFTVLAFAWIYIIGIHTTQCIEKLRESSYQFISRLAPVLFSPLPVAMIFCPAATGALLYQYFKLVHPEQCPSPPVYQPMYQQLVPMQEIGQTIREEPDSDTLLDLLKSAKSRLDPGHDIV